jgi:hypothetical protein
MNHYPVIYEYEHRGQRLLGNSVASGRTAAEALALFKRFNPHLLSVKILEDGQ